jgi:uncharacterized HAD superfamily protein
VLNVTLGWLEEHQVPFHGLIMDAFDKLKIFQDLHINLAIEDQPSHCLKLAEANIETIMMTQAYNLDAKHPNISRVHNWLEVYNLVKSR